MKDKRHQEEDRQQFYTEEQKARIQRKSNDQCVWCGKKVFLGYEGTVDHYIPLKKGGTNDEVNLVLMCHDCNQNKGSRIFPLNVAATYLDEKYYKELGEYFESYIEKYDYVSRGNLMASDVYELFFLPSSLEDAEQRARKKGKSLNLNLKRSKYLLKRAYPEDQDKIVEYFIKYLKKYNMLNSPEAALENIKFWMRFGSIYYLEKGGEVNVICCATVNKNGYISFDMFAYYSTLLAWTAVKGIMSCLGEAIMDENNLTYLPISFNMISQDELCRRRIPGQTNVVHDGTMVCKLAFMYSDKYYVEKPWDNKDKYDEAVNNFVNFIERFHDIEDDIMVYLYQNGLMDYTWMASEIIDRNYFDKKYYVKTK